MGRACPKPWQATDRTQARWGRTMGNRNGHAQVTFENGDAYQGEWKNGKRHGDGKYIYANGDR